MKIEIGESLLLSWLKHIKECQMVQTNWKASYKWELKNRVRLEQLMRISSDLFEQKHGYDLYKGTKSIDQLIGQAEIDVMGLNFEEVEPCIYAVDVAFHENGLSYGARNETVARVIKKCLRTAMCINGYFGLRIGTIVFASPKINPAVEQDLLNCVDDMGFVLRKAGLNFEIRIIANSDFDQKILEPVLSLLGNVADTSELFMRSLQMYNMFAAKRPRQERSTESRSTIRKVTIDLETIDSQGLEGLEEMKVGVIARTILRKVLEAGKASKEEIEQMQTQSYSKKTFDLQYPLLQKAAVTQGKKPIRYYANTLEIYGEDYFLCSEWFEVATNNDRPYLMKWLEMHN